MLGCIVAADGAVDEGAGKGIGVGDVEIIGDVERRGGLAVQDADCPAEFGEASVPGADVALGVGVHVGVAGVPEEPNVFVVGDGLGMEEHVVDDCVRA